VRLLLCARLCEEEGGYEYASYDNRELEHEVSFGAGVGVAVADNGEGHVEDAVVRRPLEDQEGGDGEQLSPSERCGANPEVASGLEGNEGHEHREMIRQECRKMPKKWYRNHVYRSPGAHRASGQGRVVLTNGQITGCIVGATAGGYFAAVSSAGAAIPVGTIGGCFIGAGVVEILEDL